MQYFPIEEGNCESIRQNTTVATSVKMKAARHLQVASNVCYQEQNQEMADNMMSAFHYKQSNSTMASKSTMASPPISPTLPVSLSAPVQVVPPIQVHSTGMAPQFVVPQAMFGYQQPPNPTYQPAYMPPPSYVQPPTMYQQPYMAPPPMASYPTNAAPAPNGYYDGHGRFHYFHH